MILISQPRVIKSNFRKSLRFNILSKVAPTRFLYKFLIGRTSGDRRAYYIYYYTLIRHITRFYPVRLIVRISFRTLQTVIVPRPPRMKVTLTGTPPAKKARNQTRRKKRKVYLENDESLHLMKLKFEYHLNTGMLILSKKKSSRGYQFENYK